jgi:PucR-like helix-turn-helix protein
VNRVPEDRRRLAPARMPANNGARRHAGPVPAATRGEAIRRIVDRSDMDDFTERIVDSFWERPEMEQARHERDEMRAFVRWCLDLVIRWLTDGVPPTELELDVFRARARSRAEEGLPADLAPANLRRGARYAWGALLDNATDDERLALLESADLIFEFIDRVSQLFFDAWQQASREDAVTTEEAAARALLRRICTDELPLVEDHLLAERIGFDLEHGAWPFVIVCPGRPAQHHSEVAAQLRRRGALAVSEGRRVAGLANGEAPWEGLRLDLDAIVGSGSRAVRDERGRALDEVRTAVDVAVARGQSGEVLVEDYLAELLLERSPRIASRLSARVYGPLSDELAHTLDVLVEHSFERGRAAAALPVHRNTLRDRVARIAEITGLDLDSAEGRGLAWLAWLHRRDSTSRRAGRPRF